MKSMTKLIIVVSAILIGALLVSPAAATARGASIKNVVTNDHIFVYETGLNLVALRDGGAGVTALRKFDQDDVTKTVLNEIPVASDLSFNVLDGAVGGYTGVYFPVNANGYAGCGTNPKADCAMSISIERTDLSLGVYLNVTPGKGAHVDSIDGKSVTRATQIAFKVDAPKFGSNYVTAAGVYEGLIDLRITTPDGGQLTRFGNNGVNFGAMNVSGAEFFTDSSGGPMIPVDLTGVTAGTYTAVLKFSSGTDFYKQAGTDSANSVSFTVLSKPITISTSKETVVRGNDFTVTITGESNHVYYLYIKNPSVGASKTSPLMLDGQPGVNNTAAVFNQIKADAKVGTEIDAADLGTAANVTTQSDGTRAIEFNTTSTTDDKKYTIKAIDPSDFSKYDTVDVTVEKGAVTITYEGTGSYYLGETIKLSGTNTDSKKVYLFIKGPNLGDAGRSLINLTQVTSAACVSPTPPTATECWKVVDINTDNTWSFKWDTSKLGITSLDAGTYTIYATATAADGTTNGLSGVTYQTASVILKKPFVTASVSANTVAKGDILYITGTAEGKPNNVFIWVFGKNYRDLGVSQSVNSDASYSFKLDRADTSPLYAGQYFAVVQHPMMNGIPDVIPDIRGPTGGQAIVDPTGTWRQGNASLSPTIVTLSGLQASDAATALIDLLNSPNIDDTYTKLSFNIEEPWIRIDTVGDKYVGDTFKITGTTNIAEGDSVLMTVTSASFQPTEKTQTGEFSGASGTVTVQKGDTYNTFSFDVDASTFKPDEYLVKAEAVQPSVTTTGTFNVLEGKPTTVATTVPATPVVTTAVQTPVVTAATTAMPVTTAKPQPGFGALVALVGLGAVALLVLRRR